uniref:Uncharacterized protein n=1 Tax=Anopheles epiroticus TaxID=199890 RepID=A0A182PRU4_9DIPT
MWIYGRDLSRGIEIRTCGENLAINDCKSANNIDYCYCSTDLCNKLTRTEIRRSIEASLMQAHRRNRLDGVGMHHHPPPNNSDDEDMAESSGMDGDRSETPHHRTLSSSRSSSTQQHHRDMLHNGDGAIVAPGHRDVTTQITITLKPVATSADRRSNGITGDSNMTAASERSRESNVIPSSSSSSASSRSVYSHAVTAFIVCCCSILLFATVKHVQINTDPY